MRCDVNSAYRLTAHALGKLVDAVGGYRQTRAKVEERVEREKNVVKEGKGVKNVVGTKKGVKETAPGAEKFQQSKLQILLTKPK